MCHGILSHSCRISRGDCQLQAVRAFAVARQDQAHQQVAKHGHQAEEDGAIEAQKEKQTVTQGDYQQVKTAVQNKGKILKKS